MGTEGPKRKATFRVTRLDAPPPSAVRPLAGAADAARIREKQAEERRAKQEERRNDRRKDGSRGAWGISPDGAFVAAGTPEGDVEVWSADAPAPIAVLKGHTLVESIAFVGAGKPTAKLYASAEDGTVRVWKIAGGEPPTVLGKPNQFFERRRLPYREASDTAAGS
jgi:hypothetical protein